MPILHDPTHDVNREGIATPQNLQQTSQRIDPARLERALTSLIRILRNDQSLVVKLVEKPTEAGK